MAGEPRSVGVEEEFLLVDPADGAARAVAATVLRLQDGGSGAESSDGSGLEAELHAEQLETGTRPCVALADLAAELGRTRAQAARAAARRGAAVAPLGTYPLPVEPTAFPKERNLHVLERFALTGREQLTCGCHVHVGVADAEEGVAVLDRIRPWLAPLLALSANSPFWAGEASGYASFRNQVWSRWPSAGPYGIFGSVAEYERVTAAMLDTETLVDDGMLYFDARLSVRHPTVEIRVTDVCRDREDAVLVAALARGLVETAARDWRAGRAPEPVRTEELRLHLWRAARSGLAGALVDPVTGRPAPAAAVVDRLVAHVAEALDAAGDLAVVRELVAALTARGTGADRQQAVYARTGDLRAVVTDSTVAAESDWTRCVTGTSATS
ncbi:glutamate--cysteine ligase [Pseudonocardia sp. WMMC193]|uniref:carboxylate-amine ligase n=1 Tax=Pseudonocardia sp. WMMC193 TaxID=2911965 RepID=UPI001F02F108|nr:glutamate--cysteine ligase [Pseudonocardia sp. WMMC193]MCF7553030.1 glutamate--cysteine ligase [Pseudonocardia sp. WMMC193]